MKEVATSPVQKHDRDVKVYREISNIIRSWQLTEAMKDERRHPRWDAPAADQNRKKFKTFLHRRDSKRP